MRDLKNYFKHTYDRTSNIRYHGDYDHVSFMYTTRANNINFETGAFMLQMIWISPVFSRLQQFPQSHDILVWYQKKYSKPQPAWIINLHDPCWQIRYSQNEHSDNSTDHVCRRHDTISHPREFTKRSTTCWLLIDTLIGIKHDAFRDGFDNHYMTVLRLHSVRLNKQSPLYIRATDIIDVIW